jgi:aconitate decarboxylase
MAFGLAGSRLGGMSLNTGTMTKSSHSGHGARIGVECGLLARLGWTASDDVFGPRGFFTTLMHADGHPGLLTRNFGAPFYMVEPGVGFKKHPCNYFTHRPIDAALALHEEHNIRADVIERVEIVFPRFEHLSRPQPRTGLEGKQSVEYATAIALLDGEITVESFTNERRFAPDVVALLAKLRITPDESMVLDFDTMHSIVKVWLNDGRQISKRVDKLSGWVGYPLTREQRIAKFLLCARRVLDDKAANRIIDLVERLETLHDVMEIMDIARCERAGS